MFHLRMQPLYNHKIFLLLWTRAESKNAASSYFFFSRVGFMQSLIPRLISLSVDVIISLAAAPKLCMSLYCLTIFIVFVCLRDIHFSHTKFLFEVTTEWQRVHSKFLAKSGDIFGNASCKSQLKLNLK